MSTVDRTTNVPAEWADATDLVVVGSGAGGLSAALVAAEAGLSVTLLERTELIGGTSAVSGGTMWIPGNHHMGDVGVEDSRDEALTYMRLVAGGAGDEEILATLVDEGPAMVRFFEDRLGFSFEPYPSVGPTLDYRFHLTGARHGGRSIDTGHFALSKLGAWAASLRMGSTAGLLISKAEYYGERHYMRRSLAGPANGGAEGDGDLVGGGAALVARLLHGCLEHGVTVRLHSPVRELVVEDGAVAGVWHETAEGACSLRVRRGVVLATGGYEWSGELKRRHLSRPLTHPASPEDVSRGDGLALGLAVGAQVTGLGDAWWTPVFDVTGDGPAQAGGIRSVMCRAERGFPHAILVNREGRRFVNEATNYYDLPQAFGTLCDRADGPANLPAWLIVDQQFVDRYPLIGTGTDGVADPASTWLVRDETVAGLAEQTGIDADGLSETVKRFNGFAREGVDHDFGRGRSHWDREWGDRDHGPNPSLGTLERSPFHAIRIHAGALGTKGGLRIDGHGRVLSAGGPPIQGLYAAGNVAAGSVPWGYTGPGATLGPAMTFGFVIGRHAAPRREPG